jgi:hypothetical protein
MFLEFIADPLGVNLRHFIGSGAGVGGEGVFVGELDDQRPGNAAVVIFGNADEVHDLVRADFFVDVIDAAVDLRPIEADAADAAEYVGIDFGGEECFDGFGTIGGIFRAEIFFEELVGASEFGGDVGAPGVAQLAAVHFFEHGGGDCVIGDGNAAGLLGHRAGAQNQDAQNGGGMGRRTRMFVFCGGLLHSLSIPYNPRTYENFYYAGFTIALSSGLR